MSTRGLIRCVALAVILMLSSEASAVVALQETQPEAEVTATAEEDARSSDDSQVSPTEMPAEETTPASTEEFRTRSMLVWRGLESPLLRRWSCRADLHRS